MYFNETAYLELERKVTGGWTDESREDRGTLKDILNDLHAYVETVAKGEIKVRTRDRGMDGGEYRAMISDYDSQRHDCHETAISSTKVLNRLAERNGTEPVFTGDAEQRHQVADFCLEFVSFLFRNRMRKLG